MEFEIQYTLNKELPKLAWLAQVDQTGNMVTVMHGASVECECDWMVEGVWDDAFEEGNFHRSENFFGSGIKIEGGKVYFVTTSSSVDHLLYCECQGKYLFSNSLILLLAFTGARLNDNHDYHRESLSICNGLNHYDRQFDIIHPHIKCFYQVFHENTVLSKSGISFQRRYKHHKIDSYDQYYQMMNNILFKIRNNYESDKRKTSISAFSTLSLGYDSTAVSCLVKRLGVSTCFTGNPVKSSMHFLRKKRKLEDATPIARSLGYDILYLDSRRSSISDEELYFLATNYPKHITASWSEVSFHSMTNYIENNYSAAVVFSGHHGDLVWDVNLEEKFLNDDRKLKSMMGYCSEMRLKSGFIYVPVPAILASNIKDIVNISHSPEMEPWRLHNSYDRPIPRRISESAGVKRHLFGMQKKFIANKYMWPINPTLRRQFFRYLKNKYRISPVIVYIEYLVHLLYWRRISGGALRRIGLRLERDVNFLLEKDIDLYYLMCHWAIHKLADRTAKILGNGRQSIQA